MKIQSIANNSFYGKSTYKSEAGKWWVEYQPYSWENNNHSTAEPIRYIDIMSSELPNNELIARATYRGGVLQKEVSSNIRDIDTSIYDAINDKTYNKVVNKPAMNRENSIKEFIVKLEKFRTMKFEHNRELNEQRNSLYNQVHELDLNFDEHSKDYDKGLLVAENTKRENKDLMVIAKNKIVDKFDSLKQLDERYEKLHESINAVSKQIRMLKEELELIDNVRKSGKIIDISRRDIEDANRPLWNALKYDYANIKDYYVILPHRTISMEKIFAQMLSENRLSPKVLKEVVQHVTKLIEFMR